MNSPCIQQLPDGTFTCSVRGHVYRKAVPPIYCVCDSEAVAFRGGPGTVLKKLLGRLGILEAEGCGCNEMARKMDFWGPDGCEEHMDEILDHMERQSKKRAIPIPFARVIARMLVKRAIRVARQA